MKKTNMDNQIIEFMLKRRSVLVKNMTEPGPSPEQLDKILTIASRVPDHRKLTPWRFIVIQGKNRQTLGEAFAKIKADCYPDLLPEQLQIEKNCFSRAPLIICVVYSPVEHKTSKFEQLLSTGAVCQHINIAAAALGFVSQWITGWTADHPQCQQHLGLAEHESVAAYLYIGSSDDKPADRLRPDLKNKVSYYPNPDIENTLIAQSLGTPSKSKKYRITNEVPRYLLYSLCIPMTCTLIRVSISGLGYYL